MSEILADQNCFWSFLAHHPHYIYCENQLCGIVQQPANTWSNVGFLIAAILIYRSTHVVNARVKNLFFVSSLFLFVGSTLFHMTDTSIAHAADVIGMYFVSLTGLTLAFERFTDCSKGKSYTFFFVNFLISLILLFVVDWASPLFFIQLASTLILELKLSKTVKKLEMKYVIQASLLQATAFFIWILDVKRVVCEPDNHFISGHAVWHLMSAASIYLFFKAYRNPLDKKLKVASD